MMFLFYSFVICALQLIVLGVECQTQLVMLVQCHCVCVCVCVLHICIGVTGFLLYIVLGENYGILLSLLLFIRL